MSDQHRGRAFCLASMFYGILMSNKEKIKEIKEILNKASEIIEESENELSDFSCYDIILQCILFLKEKDSSRKDKEIDINIIQ